MPRRSRRIRRAEPALGDVRRALREHWLGWLSGTAFTVANFVILLMTWREQRRAADLTEEANRIAVSANRIASSDASSEVVVEGPFARPVADVAVCKVGDDGLKRLTTLSFRVLLTNKGGRDSSLKEVHVNDEAGVLGSRWNVAPSLVRLQYQEVATAPADSLPFDVDAGRTRGIWLLAAVVTPVGTAAPGSQLVNSNDTSIRVLLRFSDGTERHLSVSFDLGPSVFEGPGCPQVRLGSEKEPRPITPSD